MDKEIHSAINEYRTRLLESGINITKMILFGSHARSDARPDSDIDLLVISKNFDNMGLWDRLCLLGRMRVGIKKSMEILGLSDKELAEKTYGSFIKEEVIRNGVEITDKNFPALKTSPSHYAGGRSPLSTTRL